MEDKISGQRQVDRKATVNNNVFSLIANENTMDFQVLEINRTPKVSK